MPQPAAVSPWSNRLKWLALMLCLGVVLARAAMQQSLREPYPASPGALAAPRTARAAAGLGLDLLACVPAMLVLVRRLIDGSFRLRAPRSFIPLGILSLWMLLSTCWAADQFAALLTAFHWLAAGAMLWAATQLVRTWLDLRLVIATCFALLPVYIIEGAIYRFQDLPTLRSYFQENRTKTLAERNLTDGSFGAEFFERKLMQGDMMGYFQSANTFGSVVALLLVVGIGVIIQQRIDRDAMKWGIPTAGILLLAGAILLALTRSRGAAAALGMGIIGYLLLSQPSIRQRLANNSRRWFIVGVAIVAFMFAAVIGHGLFHGSLPTTTLTFRWHYWVGGARLIAHHPLLGVGWNNFGANYLAYRLPKAPEEVSDPHNFIVRFFAELGIIGGVLLLAWLGRLWWELTRPTNAATPDPAVPDALTQQDATSRAAAATRDRFRPAPPAGPGVLSFVAAVAGLATFIQLTAGADWLRDSLENFLLKRILFCAAMIITGSLLALRSVETQIADDRPAPWLLYGLLLAVAGMLVHNLIDFSLFEVGPMGLFALLSGTALGIRQPVALSTAKGHRLGVVVSLVVAVTGMIAAAMLVWAPVISAERSADDADDVVRAIKLTDGHAEDPALVARQATEAVALLTDAAKRETLNAEYSRRAADYAMRATRYLQGTGRPDIETARTDLMTTGLAAINRSLATDPLSTFAHTLRAQMRASGSPADHAAIRADLLAAIAIDPNSVDLRVSVADLLTSLGSPEDLQLARQQYEEALRYNRQLAADEPKRLTPARIAEINAKIAAKR